MNYREEIRKITKTLPQSVVNGGVMSAVRWKEKLGKAIKLVDNPKSSENELRRMLYELSNF